MRRKFFYFLVFSLILIQRVDAQELKGIRAKIKNIKEIRTRIKNHRDIRESTFARLQKQERICKVSLENIKWYYEELDSLKIKTADGKIHTESPQKKQAKYLLNCIKNNLKKDQGRTKATLENLFLTTTSHPN